MNASAGSIKGASTQSIAILTAASLAANPRPLKEAMTLARAGYRVTVYGAGDSGKALEFDKALAATHGFTFEAVGLRDARSYRGKITDAWQRVLCRAAVEGRLYFGFESRWQLGRFGPVLDRAASQANAGLYILHLEQALPVGAKLLDAGYRVGLDMEDWYSEDLLPEARKLRPLRLLNSLERRLLTQCHHTTCPSRAMSEALAQEFGCPPPLVIYNAFPWAERKAIDGLVKDRKCRSIPSIHWFSQTLGEGRGLGELFAGLRCLRRDVEVHLRGRPARGFEEWLRDNIPEALRGRVFVHPLVPPGELLSRIAEHDIGFAGEETYCRSRQLTVTNKMLQYLLGGLAVVASDTAGQREVAEQAPSAILLYPPGNAQALAAHLNSLTGDPDRLAAAKQAALAAAEMTFCWERQEPKFLESVKAALAGRHGIAAPQLRSHAQAEH